MSVLYIRTHTRTHTHTLTHTQGREHTQIHRYIRGEHRVSISLFLCNIHILRREENTKYLKYAMQTLKN
jgi:hypothetical protein